MGEVVPTRKAYGTALNRIFPRFPALVSLDAEVGNSTGAEVFKKEHPENFFERFITEQNRVGAALGLARRGRLPFVSTFGAFLSRAFDQIRMSRYSDADIKFVGSHAGVSIGEDGPSQMALEDISTFRSIPDSVVLYPCDAVSAEKLVEAAGDTRFVVTVEDHYPAGGLGEAVKRLLCTLPSAVYSLAVTKKPKSGKPSDLLDFEEISAKFIADEVKNNLRRHLG